MELKSKVVIVFDVTTACLQSGYDLSNVDTVIRTIYQHLKYDNWPAPFSAVRKKIQDIDFYAQPNTVVTVETLKQKVGGVRIVLVYKFERSKNAAVVSM